MFDGNRFSITGSGKFLGKVLQALLYYPQERSRRQGEAMSAQGKGLQQILKALDAITTLEKNRLKLIKDKIATVRDFGMSDEDIASMVRNDLARLERIAVSIDMIQNSVDRQALGQSRLTPIPREANRADE